MQLSHKFAIFALILAVFVFTGCGSDEPAPTEEAPTSNAATSETPESHVTKTITSSVASLATASSLDLSYITDDFASAVIIHPARILSSPLLSGLEKAAIPLEKGMTDFIDQSGIDPRTIAHIIVLGDENSASAAAMQAPGLFGFGGGPPGQFDDVGPQLDGPGGFDGPAIPKEEKGPELPDQGKVSPQNQTLQPVNFQPPLDGPGDMGAPSVPTVIVRFTENVDPKTFFDDKPIPPLEDGKQDGLAVKIVPDPSMDLVIHFADSKTMIVTKSTLLKKMVETKSANSPLISELKQIDSANDLIVVIDMTHLSPMLVGLGQIFGAGQDPNMALGLKLVSELKTLTITGGISSDSLLSVSFVGASTETVSTVNDKLTELANLGRQQYEMMKPAMLKQEAPVDEAGKKVLEAMADQLVAGITNKADGTRLTISIPKPADLNSLPAILKPVIEDAKKAAGRAQQSNQLKQVGLAFHNYHAVYNSLPSAGTDYSGEKKGLSWRVHILPFIEEVDLYNQFNLDEPWDSEHNKALISQIPELFQTPGVNEEGKTVFQVVVGENTSFNLEKGLGFREFTDGLSNTIMVVEAGADKADTWTKPGGLTLDEENPIKTFGTIKEGTLSVLISDGSVRTVDIETISNETIKALITRNGGEIIDDF